MAGTRQFYAFRRRGLNAALESERSANVSITIETESEPRTASVILPLLGPGDVRGLVAGAIANRWPAPGSAKTPAGSVAYVEFTDDDFPWVLSPKDDVQPTPWLTLIVVPDAPEAGAIYRADRSPLPELLINAELSAKLPDPTEAWVLAHCEEREGGDISRILSARWLGPGSSWRAALVPAFESGRRAGLGEDPDGAEGLSLLPGKALRLPVYDTWTFRTSTTPAFEDLVKELAPAKVSHIPPFVVWSEDTQKALDAREPVARSWVRSALKHEDMEFEAVSDAPRWTAPRMVHAQAEKVRAVVDREDAIVPPRYGRWMGPDGTVPTALWFDDVNLDPSLRLAAGYGAEIVRTHQEDLVRAAWDFAGDVAAANHLIASARFGAQSARKIHAALFSLSPDRLIALADNALVRIRAKSGRGSSAAVVAGSAYDGLGPAWRLMRRASRRSLGATLQRRPNFGQAAQARGRPFVPQGLPVIDPSAEMHAAPGRLVTDQHELQRLLNSHLDVEQPQTVPGDDHFAEALTELRRAPPPGAGKRHPRSLSPGRFAANLAEALDPVRATGARLSLRIIGGSSDPFQPIRPVPALDFPILENLAQLAPGLVSPALSSLKPNRLTLLELDRPFCEALFVGANHELTRELIWRKYPGRLDMTPLRQLFPRQAIVSETAPENDTQPLANWMLRAGEHLTDAVKSILLLRTDLFELFPETVMFVFPAIWNGDTARNLAPAQRFEPVQARVRGRLPPDALYLGYPLDAGELRGEPAKPVGEAVGSHVGAGYYLVFHGPEAQDSFGFDSPHGLLADQPVSSLRKWDDLAWTHLGWTRERPNISLAGASTERPADADSSLALGRDSAALAAIMASRSLTVAIHLSDLIDPAA